MLRVILISICFCVFTLGCSTVVDESVQSDISKRAKQTAFNLLVNINQTFADIGKGRPPYVREGNPNAYVYIYDLDLNVVAHPDRSIVGTSHANRVDDRHDAYPKEILERALGRKRGIEGWIEYTEQGLMRLAFYELAQGRDGLYYIIVSTAPVGGTLKKKS